MYSKQNIYKANSIPIKEILQNLGEPLRKTGKNFRWLRHDSVSMTNNLWYQHSMKRGGLPIDFLVTFFNYSKAQAIDYLLNEFTDQVRPINLPSGGFDLKPPQKNHNNIKIEAYLEKFRFVGENIVDTFMNQELIYEDSLYHNCNFVGLDGNGIIKHIHTRSTHLSLYDIKGNVEGSNGQYPFSWLGQDETLFVFEAPIDLLSYITLNQQNWQQHSYLALCGLSSKPIFQKLNDQPTIKKVILCLDNDVVGQTFAAQIMDELHQIKEIKCEIKYSQFKDFNEDLKFVHNQPVLGGLRESFYHLLNENLNLIIEDSINEKDKTLKDLMNSISVIYYGKKFTNKKQIDKYKKALLISGRDALMLARQQYRHFGKHYSMQDMIEFLNNKNEPFMKHCEQDEKLYGFTQDLNIIKVLFTTKIYYTKEEKLRLIEALMSLAKRCIYTHVFLTLKEKDKMK